MREFKKMADILHPCNIGSAKVDLFEIKENSFSSLMQGISTGKYARLRVNGGSYDV